jgi:hypothetical protein
MTDLALGLLAGLAPGLLLASAVLAACWLREHRQSRVLLAALLVLADRLAAGWDDEDGDEDCAPALRAWPGPGDRGDPE